MAQRASACASTMPEPQYPFWLGGLAASAAASFTHPLDLTKVRMQIMPLLPSGRRPTMFSTIRWTVRKFGWASTYTGISACLMRQMTYSLIRIGSYETIKRRITQGQDPKNPTRLILSAAVAGALGGIAGNPADIVLVRMTTDSLRKPENQYRYRHGFDGLMRLVREERIIGLTRGLGPNTIRAILMNSSQLASYDYIKALIIRRHGLKDGIGLHIISSTFAGAVATTVSSPVDVIRSRIMSKSDPRPFLEVLRKMLRQDGVRSLFKGWTPAFVRLAPNTVLMFVFLEQLKRMWTVRI
ncbi:mitochondrial carrier domain-containing protein [Cantharellus anzutake]|uniref:mitochondrial carrier domain-containing protein n=1 Tax=Cantharellus anzutake TaxID=1750568 RepID=UPI00190371D2|nr:mitochondrial carrier domain-containing protein [Cantharellus anzutake]KAF8334123.1 mitochondrial carrier domain-containing protein [Cantharellus anzutake]